MTSVNITSLCKKKKKNISYFFNFFKVYYVMRFWPNYITCIAHILVLHFYLYCTHIYLYRTHMPPI